MMECLWRRLHILLQVSFWVCFVTGSNVEWRRVGEKIVITCSTDKPTQSAVYLYKSYHQRQSVFYLLKEGVPSRTVAYKDKVKVTGFNKLRATISNLTVNDTGVFWCQYLRHDGPTNHETENKEGETLLVVNGPEKVCPTHGPYATTSTEESSQTLWIVGAVTVCSLVLLVLIILLISVKRCCVHNGKYRCHPQSAVGPPAHRSDSVYEQMRPQRATSMSPQRATSMSPQRATSMSHSSARVLINPTY
ncbi:uncharacterized protein LOC116219906 isoform X2 [Clupea harengus]|uniref:Uncharacterized protein LOC116219906 isoform X1 n=1 Tax=Clupea harengus TaxID=7950 RepID=A0A6P8F9T2_CLUHA|nr:uncharacterized protein LOC116219906 isoform X1 [Clupea harengus]XP_042559874.1 uncharacterized protein LOC116219906 isoform X2 [Clupea harengus]